MKSLLFNSSVHNMRAFSILALCVVAASVNAFDPIEREYGSENQGGHRPMTALPTFSEFEHHQDKRLKSGYLSGTRPPLESLFLEYAQHPVTNFMSSNSNQFFAPK